MSETIEKSQTERINEKGRPVLIDSGAAGTIVGTKWAQALDEQWGSKTSQSENSFRSRINQGCFKSRPDEFYVFPGLKSSKFPNHQKGAKPTTAFQTLNLILFV